MDPLRQPSINETKSPNSIRVRVVNLMLISVSIYAINLLLFTIIYFDFFHLNFPSNNFLFFIYSQ